ncbi:MAG: carboxypeptidase regulatory-like domain-containing protein, partial [Candidatus Kerfeldbacteria bacterium]|nr:carboxypeptidase regulatory-like domain-containing protein [Candidatus Kerfeldbacteria bacterium]
MRHQTKQRILFTLGFLSILFILFFTLRTASAAVSVTGKITLPDGVTGVQGASINIHDNTWSVYQSTTTGSDGSFTLNDLPTCTCVIQVYANHATYADPDDTAISVTAGQAVNAGTIKLAVHNVIGKLTAPDGVTGLSSVGISFQSSDSTIYRWASTDSTGQFRFRVPSAGTYTLRVNNDYTSGNQTLYFAPPETSVTVQDIAQALNVGSVLMKNANVTGTVTDADGTTPVSTAYVYVHNSNWSISRSATTPSNGTFGLYLPVGQYTLEVSLPSAGGNNPNPVAFTVSTEAAGASLGAIRKTTPNVFFKVLKKDGTTAVSNASISLHNATWTVSRSTSTAADGTASATLPSAGTYTAEVWANDPVESSPENFTITYTSGNVYFDGTNGSQPILLQAPSVQGKVQKADGSAVSSATVYLSNSTNTVNKSASTDSTGAFTLPAVATGTYTLQVSPPYSTTGLVGPDPVSLALTKGVTNTTYVATPLTLTQALKTITGKVTKPNGTAVASANINAWKNSGSSGSTSAQTDATGTYSLTVGGGDWFVSASPMWTGSTSPDWGFFGSPSTVTFSQSNSIAETQTLNITVEAFTATVTGQIQNPDGTTPAAGTSVNVWRERGGWNSSSLDSGGNFTIKIAPGTYNIEVFTSNWQYGTPELAPITLKDGETKNMGILKLLAKNEFITGKVSDSNNQALSSQSVSCWKQRGGGYVSGTTNSTGQYSLSVSQGIWECDAWPTFYSYGQGTSQIQYSRTQDPQEVTVNTNETKRDVNFVFSINDATINGTIQNEAGQVLTDIYGWVQATNADTSSNSARYNNPGGDAQAGRFSIRVPAGTYDLGIWLPYQSGYTAKSEKTVTVAAGGTVNDGVITVLPNNATLRGQLKDASGNVLTSVSGSIYATNGASGQQWANITNGSYSLALSAGEWRIGYWVDSTSGFLNQPLGENNKVTLTANATTTYDLTLLKLDSTISGTVTDPDGNPLPNVWINVDTELGGKKKLSSVYTMYGGTFSLGTYTDSAGKFTMQAPGGSYFVTATTSTAFGYINPRAQEVTVSPTKSATLTFHFLRPDATITGTVFLDTVSTQSFRSFRAFSSQTSPAYVSAWSSS